METTNKKKIRVRGTGCYDPSDNSFGFTPFNDGPSSQTNVKSCKGGGKSWETTGSDPSRMITLKTKMSSPDQYSDVLAQFNQLTKDIRGYEFAGAALYILPALLIYLFFQEDILAGIQLTEMK